MLRSCLSIGATLALAAAKANAMLITPDLPLDLVTPSIISPSSLLIKVPCDGCSFADTTEDQALVFNVSISDDNMKLLINSESVYPPSLFFNTGVIHVPHIPVDMPLDDFHTSEADYFASSGIVDSMSVASFTSPEASEVQDLELVDIRTQINSLSDAELPQGIVLIVNIYRSESGQFTFQNIGYDTADKEEVSDAINDIMNGLNGGADSNNEECGFHPMFCQWKDTFMDGFNSMSNKFGDFCDGMMNKIHGKPYSMMPDTPYYSHDDEDSERHRPHAHRPHHPMGDESNGRHGGRPHHGGPDAEYSGHHAFMDHMDHGHNLSAMFICAMATSAGISFIAATIYIKFRRMNDSSSSDAAFDAADQEGLLSKDIEAQRDALSLDLNESGEAPPEYTPAEEEKQ